MSPELVVFGNLLVDDVVYADGRTRMGQPGGAVLYLALAARLFGISVGVVSRRGDDYPVQMLAALEERGIDLGGVCSTAVAGVRTWLLYEGRQRRVVHRLSGPSHEEVSPRYAELPTAWRRAAAFHLAPMPRSVQSGLVESLGAERRALLSIDPYDLLDEELLPRWRALLERVDVLFLSEDEMLLDGEAVAAAGRLAAGRDAQVVFKRGRRGGVFLHQGQQQKWLPRAAEEVDPTGAGDAFAAGFLAARLRQLPTRRALQQGVVAASFALAGQGPDGLLVATPAAASERLAGWFASG